MLQRKQVLEKILLARQKHSLASLHETAGKPGKVLLRPQTLGHMASVKGQGRGNNTLKEQPVSQPLPQQSQGVGTRFLLRTDAEATLTVQRCCEPAADLQHHFTSTTYSKHPS